MIAQGLHLLGGVMLALLAIGVAAASFRAFGERDPEAGGILAVVAAVLFTFAAWVAG